jgi:DNA-binding MarR family transcriptional regulator
MDVQRLEWPGASEDQHRLMAGYWGFYRARPRILTITDLRVLEVLVYKPRDLTCSIAAIANAAAMSPSTVTTVINRLTVIGVLTRTVGRGRRPNDYEIHPEWLARQK